MAYLTQKDREISHKIRLAKKELEKASPHIQWYIEYLDGVIEGRDEQIKEYVEFFRTLDKFLPNHNPILR